MMKKRVTKDQWLQAALDSLRETGVNGIAVERLARKIGTSKSGFYWHFEDRNDLLKSILNYWENEFTDTVINNISHLDETAAKKLQITSEMIMQHQLGKYDLPIRVGGNEDNAVKARIKSIDRKRLQYIGGLYKELGFRGIEAETRATLFIMYHAYWNTMFQEDTAARKKQKLAAVNRLLLKK